MNGDREERTGWSWIIFALLLLGGGFVFNVLNAPNNPTGKSDEGYTALFMLVGGGLFVAKVLMDSMDIERAYMAGEKRHQYGLGSLVFGILALLIILALVKTP